MIRDTYNENFRYDWNMWDCVLKVYHLKPKRELEMKIEISEFNNNDVEITLYNKAMPYRFIKHFIEVFESLSKIEIKEI